MFLNNLSVLCSRTKQTEKSLVIFCTLISIITLTNAYYLILKCKTDVFNFFTDVFDIIFHIIFQCTPSSHKWNPSYRFSNRRCMHSFWPRCCCRFLYLDYICCMPVSKLQLLLCFRLCFLRYVYIYIYMCVCVCVCMCVWILRTL